MQCLPYAHQRWDEITSKSWSWGVTVDVINGPKLYIEWNTGRKGYNITEATSLPVIVIYSGGKEGHGHTAIVESYDSTDKTYHYSDHNGNVADGLWEADLTQAQIKSLFSAASKLTYKGCLW